MTRVPHAHEAIVCSCMCVDEEEVGDAIRAGARTLEAIGEACEAGTGCRSCHGPLALMLEEFTARELECSTSPGALQQLGLFGDRRTQPPGGAARRPTSASDD